MTRKLFTIGYEGATQDGFITALKWAGVEAIVDVRNRAYANHTGFASRELSDALKRNRMDYMALSAPLIAPPVTFCDSPCRAAFEDHAPGCCALDRECTNRVAQLAMSKSVCLLCYEFDPHAHCHRGNLANRIVERTGQQTEHLFVAPSIPFVRINAHPPVELRDI